MANIFLSNPPKVAVLGLRGKDIYVAHTQIFLGDAPKDVVAAATSQTRNKSQVKILEEYYDSLEKLGPATLGGSRKNRKNKSGGGPDVDSPEDDPTLDLDLDDIAKALDDTSADSQKLTVTGKVSQAELAPRGFDGPLSYQQAVHIFPEDTLAVVKEKLQITTGIPSYRQHIFYETPQTTTTYALYVDGFYLADMRGVYDSIAANSSSVSLGLPVDKYLFDNRDRIRVEALDTFRLATDTLGSAIYVMDLASFILPRLGQIRAVSSDKYQMEVLYYGFVIKYWPQIPFEGFKDLVRAEEELYAKYPALARPTKILSQIYSVERGIITQMYRAREKADALVESGQIQVAITQVSLFVPNAYTPINPRNLFDMLETSASMPEIRAYFVAGGKSYEAIKRYRRVSQKIEFPAGIIQTGVMIALAVEVESANPVDKYMFLNVLPSGGYTCRAHFPDHLEYDFTDIFEKISQVFSPVVSRISTLGRAVFPRGGKLSEINLETIVYRNLSMYVFWKRHMNVSSFQALKSIWEPYITANIISRRPIQGFDRFEFNFIKGMYEFDRGAIQRVLAVIGEAEMKNQYIWLSSAAAHSRWQTLYGHRTAKMVHRVSDVRFEISNIHEREFQLFFGYVVDFILKAKSSEKFRSAGAGATGNLAAVQQLREFDPELYNMKKSGSTHVYSRYCQRGHQPRAWKPEEFQKFLAGLSGPERARVEAHSHKFWNFTAGAPAIYNCPGRKFQHLHFMVGYHPKGYCLPCCKKLEQTNREAFSGCLQHHSLSREADNTYTSKHIMKPTKNPGLRRLSYIPAGTLGRILGDAPAGEDYYILGVEQTFPGIQRAGMFFSVAAILGLAPAALAKELVSYISAREPLELAGGAPAEYYQSTEELLASLESAMNSPGVAAPAIEKLYEEILAEFAADTRKVYVFTYDATQEKLIIPGVLSGSLRTSDLERKYGLVVRRDQQVHPCMGVDTREYFRYHSDISSRFFPRGHPGNSGLQRVITWMLGGDTKKFYSGMIPGQYKKLEILVGATRKVYACILEEPPGSHKIYAAIPFEDAKVFSEVPVVSAEKVFDSPDQVFSWEALEKYLAATGQPVQEIWKLSGDESWSAALTATGLHWFQGGPHSETSSTTRMISYDPREINKSILAAEVPKDRSDEIAARAFYNNYLYRLFVGEFIRSLDGERDHALRTKIYDLVGSSSFSRGLVSFKQSLQKLVPAEDYAKLIEQLSGLILGGTFSKKRLRRLIENTTYSFDHILFRELETLTRDQAVQKIRKLAHEFAVDGKIKPGEFPNIYLGCSDNNHEENHIGTGSSSRGENHRIYCEGRKLICERPVDELADLLAGDLESPLMRRYILESSQPYVGFFKFQEHPDEVITVRILV